MAQVQDFHLSEEALTNVRFMEPRFMLSEGAAEKWIRNQKAMRAKPALEAEDIGVV